MASAQDAWYLSLLGLAENFRNSKPSNIKACIQCLQAVFYFKPPQKVEARTHLQLCNILLEYTKNEDLALFHAGRAWELSQYMNNFDDVRFEAASVLAEVYERRNQHNSSLTVLRKAIELSQHHVFWHCRLIFQLAQIHAHMKDISAAQGLLAVGADYSQYNNLIYTKYLFILSQCMLSLVDKKFESVVPLLTSVGHEIDNWPGNPHQKEYLKIYYLFLQVCHYLTTGQIKTVKTYLKQLQQSIQTIMAPTWPADSVICGANVGEMFIWMPKEHLYLLVYLVTVMHSMQAGYMDKAQKYTEKAFSQIENLKRGDNKSILSLFQLMLLELISMCHLIMGNKSTALTKISQACSLCRKETTLFRSHESQLHVLLGLYSMSMNSMEAAETQFLTAINVSEQTDLTVFANLNLAIVYIRLKRDAEVDTVLKRLSLTSQSTISHSLKAASYYVQGLQAFFLTRYNEAKRYLRETLKLANSEDLNRLTSCSLVLLGHIFLSLGNNKESMNMVTPAMQLASKIPDVHIQLWATAILKDLYKICGEQNREKETYQMHQVFSEKLLKDHFQSTQMPEFELIKWVNGPMPSPKSISAASTSQR